MIEATDRRVEEALVQYNPRLLKGMSVTPVQKEALVQRLEWCLAEAINLEVIQ